MDIKQRTGIAAGEYKRRRRQLMDMAGEDAILVLPAAAEGAQPRYPLSVPPGFGFPVPDRLPGTGSGAGADSGPPREAILFCRERDAEREAWDGSRAGKAR